jgi:hypothetical protein
VTYDFHAWTTRLPQDDPRLPRAAREELERAAEDGRYLSADERDAIIAAAGGDPADWQPVKLPQPPPTRPGIAGARSKHDDDH